MSAAEVRGCAIKWIANPVTVFWFRRKILSDSSVESTHGVRYIILHFTISLEISL